MKNITVHIDLNCHVIGILPVDLIDCAMIDQIFKDIDEVAAIANNRIVINFANVNRCSSSVLGKLIGLRKRILKTGGRMTLCECGEQMMAAMKVTGLRTLFDVMDSEREAVQYMIHDVVAWKPGAEQ